MTHIKRINEMAVRFADSIDNKVDFAKKQKQINLNNFKNEVKRIFKKLPIDDMIDVIDTLEYSSQKGHISEFTYNDIRVKNGYIGATLIDNNHWKCGLTFDKENFYLCIIDDALGLNILNCCVRDGYIDDLKKSNCTIDNMLKNVEFRTYNFKEGLWIKFKSFDGKRLKLENDNIWADSILIGLQKFERNINDFVDNFFNSIKN